MNELHAHAFGIDQIKGAGSRKNATKTRGRPFGKGDAGRPKGALNRTTLAAQILLNGEAEALTRKAIELALDGDTMALRLCLERICPPRKELPVEFILPPLQTPADLTAATAAILKAAAEGRLLLSQAVEFGKLLQLYSQTANSSGMDEIASLTDEELRARILRAQARAAIDIDWHTEGKAAASPQSG